MQNGEADVGAQCRFTKVVALFRKKVRPERGELGRNGLRKLTGCPAGLVLNQGPA
jgi:hypothetical protein